VPTGSCAFGCSFFSRNKRNSPNKFKSVVTEIHVLEQNFLTAAIIELGGPAVGVAGDPLSGFKGAVIFQKIRDAGRPE
jgi:hypothetical protein